MSSVSAASTTGLAAARKAGINSSTGQISSTATTTGLSTANAVAPYLQPYIRQIVSIQTEETSNTALINAYQTMQGLLTNLETASSELQANYSTSANAFNNRTVSLSTTGSTSASSVLSATATEGTPTGTYTVVVNNIATADSIAGISYASSSTALGLATGTFTIKSADGSAASSISVNSSTTLANIESQINAHSSTNGVTATILNVASGYRLVITANNTDEAITTTNTSGTPTTALGINTSAATVAAGKPTYLSTAAAASLTVDGLAVTSSSNTVSSVIPGVTLNLTSASTETLNLTIGHNVASVFTTVNTFVTAYNQWRAFVNSNEAVSSSGTAGSTAVLWGDSTLRTVSGQIDNALSFIVDNNSLTGIGLSLNGSNQIELNSSTLSTNLTNNFSSVQLLFAGDSTSHQEGIAQSIYSTALEYGDTSVGYVQTLVSSLQTQNATHATEVSALQQQASEYETFLLAQYGRLTSKITANDQEASLLTALTSNNSNK